MKKVALMVVVLAVLLAGLPAMAEESITVFNWFDYIDSSVIDLFEEETGIKVNYVNFTTNEEMYAKLAKSSSAYDVIFPSDYIIERLIQEDMLLELDKSKLPNSANLLDWIQKPDYDPDGKYSVAYMWGTVGILYNTDYVSEPITSWGALFDPQYKKDVFMMSSMRDTLGITLKYLGHSVNTPDAEALKQAQELLMKQKSDGIVKGYFVDETKEKMISGEAALAVIYSGDAMYSITECEDGNLAYVVPEEGSNVWLDGMCIPKNAQNVEGALKFIDFLCRPDIAYLNMEYIYYSSPIKQVVDMMTEEELGYAALNPSQEIIDRCEFFHDLGDALELYTDVWTEICA